MAGGPTRRANRRTWDYMQRTASDYLVGTVIATEVPPKPIKDEFTAVMIPIAITAVCEVIRNRAASSDFPDSPVEVVLQIKQFSGVLRGLRLSDVGHRDIWIEAVAGRWFPKHVEQCVKAWKVGGRSTLVGAATHYFSPVSMIPPGRVPKWAEQMTQVIVPALNQEYFSFFSPT